MAEERLTRVQPPIDEEELRTFKTWVAFYLGKGGNSNGRVVLERSAQLIRRLANKKPADPSFVKDTSPSTGIIPWGYFSYDVAERQILRDEGSVVLPTDEREHRLLVLLLGHPYERIPRERIETEVGSKRAKWYGSSTFFDQAGLLNVLRPKIGDVPLGKDPDKSNLNLWRYINTWVVKGDSGLVLMNRNSADVEALLQASPRRRW